MPAEVLGQDSVESRAGQSRGISNKAIYTMVERALARRNIQGTLIADVGCGVGNLYGFVRSRFKRYIGVDVLKYADFPVDAEFVQIDLDSRGITLPCGRVDVTAAVETIEHLENPREFMRKLAATVKPGGWVVVTTPNQLSLYSLLMLIFKHRFGAFQDVHYPTHLTALLEIDLIRIATESNLKECDIEYSLSGRIPLTPWHYPRFLAKLFPRRLSDNVLLIGKKN